MNEPKLNIDLNPHDLAEVQAILKQHIPNIEVWAFGSRVKWTAKSASDLDLALITNEPLSIEKFADIKYAFDESDLPMRVDIVDWATTSESFRKIIEKDKVVVQKGMAWGMSFDLPLNVSEISLKDAVIFIVDNRGKTAPTESTGIALIATNCVNNKDLYPQKLNLRYVSQDTYENWFRSHPQPGDILLTNKGSQNGAVCLVPSPVDFCIAQDMVALRADPKKINPLYLFAALRSDLVQKRIKALNVDAVIPHLKKTDFDKLYIPLPERRVQDWIGDSYFELSSRIELLRETNTTLESIAQALFKSWFVDFDPVHANAGTQAPSLPPEIQSLFPSTFVESPLGLVPEGWGVCTLGDVMENHSTTFNFTNVDKVVFVNTGDVSEGVFLHKNYSSPDGLPGQAKKTIKRDDILFSEIRPKNNRYAYVNFDPDEYVVSTKFMILRSLGEIHPRYIYQIIKQSETIDYFNVIAESRSGTFPQITFDAIKSYKIIRPSKACIEKYIDLLIPILTSIDENYERQKTLTHLRDTLLPRLISGQLRLPEVEEMLQ